MVFSVLWLMTSTKWPRPKQVQLTDPSSKVLLTLGASGSQGVTLWRGGGLAFGQANLVQAKSVRGNDRDSVNEVKAGGEEGAESVA